LEIEEGAELTPPSFSLSFLKGVGLLHTTCGTPNYVAPEVKLVIHNSNAIPNYCFYLLILFLWAQIDGLI